MNFLPCVTLAFIFLTTVQCVDWGLAIQDLFKISNITTQKGHPLQVPKEHSKLQIEGLNGTIYNDTFSHLDHISALVISSSFVTGIEDGALCFSSSLKQLEIDFKWTENTIIFNANVLKNCEKLEELALIFNFDVVTKIEDDTFRNLTNLKKLILRNHRIPHLRKDFLEDLKSLTRLVLFGTYMEQIDNGVFEDLKDLQELDMNIHALEHLPKGLFKDTSKLITLDLSHGNLTDLSWDEFEGLSSLKTLSLFQNRIQHFDADKIARYMPSLEELSIELNLGGCKKLELFATELKQKFTHPIEVNYKYKYDADSDTCIKE